MDKDTRTLLRVVTIFDIIILIIAALTTTLFFKNYTILCIVGLIIAYLNFMLNAAITNYTLGKSGASILIVMGSLARIIITIGAAIILCNNDIYNYLAFFTGYSLHYIAIIIYGVTRGHTK